MKNIKELYKLLTRTGDGLSVIFWWIVFAGLLAQSIAISGLRLEQLKYIFFALIAFLLFTRFRISDFEPDLKTNIWGILNTTAFGFFILYLEFFK